MIREIIENTNAVAVKLFKDVAIGELFKLDVNSSHLYIKVSLDGTTSDNYCTTQVGYINIESGLGDSFENDNDNIEMLRECYLYDGKITITHRLK